MAHDGIQSAFHDWWHIRPSHEELFEIRGREHQHLSGSVHPEEIIALSGLRHLRPVLKVRKFLLRLLCKEIVCKANRQLAVPVQFAHDSIVVRIILKATARIDRAGYAEAIQFPEEEPG